MRQIVLLETVKGREGTTRVMGFYWFAVTLAVAQVPRPQFVSAGVGLVGPAVLTTEEQAALESGAVREERFDVELSASTTSTQTRAELERRWTDRAAAIAAEPATRRFYGVSWDGTTWA